MIFCVKYWCMIAFDVIYLLFINGGFYYATMVERRSILSGIPSVIL